MKDSNFCSEHLELIRHLNPQKFEFRDGHKYLYSENDYLVPEQNFERLESILNFLSCSVYKPDKSKKNNSLLTKEINHDSMRRFCRMDHGIEQVRWVHAGIREERGGTTFYSMGDDLFNVTTNITINPETQERVLKEYLAKFQKVLEDKCKEGLALCEDIRWGGPIINLGGGGYLHNETLHLYHFLDFLEEFAKELKPKERADWYKDVYNFRICSKHKEELPTIAEDWKLSVICKFKEYDINLRAQDINVGFHEEPVFRVDGNLIEF